VAEPALALTSARLPGWDGLWDVVLGGGLIRGIVPSHRVPVRPEVEVVDLDGRYLLPGLWDEHVHFTQWALYRSRIELGAARTAAGTAALVADRIRSSEPPAAGPVIGVGFRDALWPDEPTQALLDDAAQGGEVVLFSADLHCVWVSSAAALRMGIPTGADGIAREAPAFAAQDAVNSLPDAQLDALVRQAADAAVRRGVVGIVDFEMGGSLDDWRRRADAARLPFRVEASVYPAGLDDVLASDLVPGTPLDADELLSLRYLKVIIDGSLNTRTAYCRDDYAGLPGSDPGHGVLAVPPSELTGLLRRAVAFGLTPAVHAIGDEANTVALDVFASLGSHGRIEHAQLLADSDLPRFGRLGVIASVQPRHAPDDRDAAERLWPGRTGRAFPLRRLLDSGATLAFGSDAPVSALDPWVQASAAVYRTSDERPAWHPEQRVTFAEALAASTRGRSTLLAGEPADLVVVDQDPFEAGGAAELAATPVAGTVVAGRVSYRGF